MPTVVTRYLNTGSTSGGDGTTNATTGANRAWPTLNHSLGELNTAYGSGLVAADVQVDLICSGATDDTTTLSNAWPTSDTTRYIHMQATADMDWDDSAYIYGRSGNFAAALIINTNSVRLTGVQVFHGGNLNVGGNHGIQLIGIAGEAILDRVKVVKTQNAGQGAIQGDNLAGKVVLRNCVTGQREYGAVSFGWTSGVSFTNMPSNSTVIIYNLTSVRNNNGGTTYGVNIGFTAGGSNKVARVKNVLVQTSANGVNIVNSTTSDTATNHHNTGEDATFVDYTNGDLRLTSADTVARNLGTDLSGVSDWPFSIDIDLTTRPVGSAWDIGAHEELTVARPRVFAAFIG